MLRSPERRAPSANRVQLLRFLRPTAPSLRKSTTAGSSEPTCAFCCTEKHGYHPMTRTVPRRVPQLLRLVRNRRKGVTQSVGDVCGTWYAWRAAHRGNPERCPPQRLLPSCAKSPTPVASATNATSDRSQKQKLIQYDRWPLNPESSKSPPKGCVALEDHPAPTLYAIAITSA